jgi:hypothetical protein
VVRVHPSTYKAAPFLHIRSCGQREFVLKAMKGAGMFSRSPGKIEELTFVRRVSMTGLGERMVLSIKSAHLFPSQIIAYATA